MSLPDVRSNPPGMLRSVPVKLTGSRTVLLMKYIFLVLPRVKRLLRNWVRTAALCPDPELRAQALASLKDKAFHCQGGAVFAVGQVLPSLLSFIVAYQTLCDYLDNLCDRAGETNGEAFWRLHQSLIDALDTDLEPASYYEYFPFHDDGGYINLLVEECRRCLAFLPSYSMVKDDVLRLAEWYTLLQVKKHLSVDIRTNELRDWVNENIHLYPGLYWNEFAAATGSTLALFALLRLACYPSLDTMQIRDTKTAYFPWICALHILLDYYIDQGEDVLGGDLNFTFYYRDRQQLMERLKLYIRKSRMHAAGLPTASLDIMVVEGLLAMYLSDRKVVQQGFQAESDELLIECGGSTCRVFKICRWVRIFL